MRRYVFPVFGPSEVALLAAARSWPSSAPAQRVWALDKHTGAMTARLRVPARTDVVGWTADGTLRLLLENRRLVEWHPGNGRLRRLLELPGPSPDPAEWAAATVAFPSGSPALRPARPRLAVVARCSATAPGTSCRCPARSPP